MKKVDDILKNQKRLENKKRIRVMRMENKKLKIQIATGVILMVVGVFLLANDYIVEKREQVFSQMNLELTELLTNKAPVEQPTNTEATPTTQQNTIPTPPPTPEPATDYETYVGILDIPKISFNKGFYKKESSLNNVKFNIKILDSSSYPDEENGNVIIIGHSGNYSNSYFGNLYQLENGDTASITYGGKKYTYKIVNIYTDTKDGTVTVYRDETKNCLTLITCTKDDETTQTIYIMELIHTE